MPYIICTNRPGFLPESDPVAVSTLEEAREAMSSAIGDSYISTGAALDAEWAAFHDLPLPGVVGPLPDGYVVDVREVSWLELARLCGMDCGALCSGPNDEVIAAYNS